MTIQQLELLQDCCFPRLRTTCTPNLCQPNSADKGKDEIQGAGIAEAKHLWLTHEYDFKFLLVNSCRTFISFVHVVVRMTIIDLLHRYRQRDHGNIRYFCKTNTREKRPAN